MSLLKNITPGGRTRSLPSLSTFPFLLVSNTKPIQSLARGLLSSFLQDEDDPADNFGCQPTDFSYEKFQLFAQDAAGDQDANKWLAMVGEDTFAITHHNEWHRFLLTALRFLLIHVNSSISDLKITFAIHPQEQGPQLGSGAILETRIDRGFKRGGPDTEDNEANGRSPKRPRRDEIPDSNSEPFSRDSSIKRGALDTEDNEAIGRSPKRPRRDEIPDSNSEPLSTDGSEGRSFSEQRDVIAAPQSLVWDPTSDESNTSPPADMVQLVMDAGAAAALYEIDALDGISLDDVARYFGVSVDNVQRRNALTLRGTKQPLRLDQTVFVYRYLRRCDHSAPLQLCGQVLADGTGMGKTRSAYALVAEMRWIAINVQHVRNHPDQHLSPRSKETVCPSLHWRGGECACVEGSIRHRWAQRLFGGPYLAIPPSAVIDQWEFAAEEYFHRFIDDQGLGHDSGGAGRTEFIDPYVWIDGHFHRAASDDPLSPEDFARLKEAITGEGYVCSSGAQRHQGITRAELGKLGDKMHNDYYVKLKELTVDVAPRRVPAGGIGITLSSKLIILADSTIKRKTSKAPKELMITVPTRIRDAPPPSMYEPVDIHFAIPPTLVMLDEAHLAKGGDALFSRLQDVLDFTTPPPGSVAQACRPSWLFMSATVFNKGPSSLHKLLEYLYADQVEAQREGKRLSGLDDTYNTLCKEAAKRPDADRLRDRITEFSRDVLQRMAPVVIARREGTPMGVGNRVAAYAGQIHHHHHNISLQDDELQAIEDVGSMWRNGKQRGLGGKTVSALVTQSTFLPYYCATLMPGLAFAHNACVPPVVYPFTIEDIGKDIEKPTSLVRANLDRHNSSSWLGVISNIINTAFWDRGKNKDEPGKHVLIVTAVPGVAYHLYRVLKRQGNLRSYTDVTLLSSKLNPRARSQEIRNLRQNAAGNRNKIQVVISTAELVGTGIDGLSFCNYLVIYGDLTKPEQFEQVRGRVARVGQLYDTRVYSLSVQHDVQELVRRSVQHPDAKLNSLGVF